jgi:hypothetical protein
MFEPMTLTGGIIITKAVVAKATAASTAYAVTVVAVNAAITGAIAGGSSAALVTYLSTPCGRKALKSVITHLSLAEVTKLAETIAKSARVFTAFLQDTDVVFNQVGLAAQIIAKLNEQGRLIPAPGVVEM